MVVDLLGVIIVRLLRSCCHRRTQEKFTHCTSDLALGSCGGNEAAQRGPPLSRDAGPMLERERAPAQARVMCDRVIGVDAVEDGVVELLPRKFLCWADDLF